MPACTTATVAAMSTGCVQVRVRVLPQRVPVKGWMAHLHLEAEAEVEAATVVLLLLLAWHRQWSRRCVSEVLQRGGCVLQSTTECVCDVRAILLL